MWAFPSILLLSIVMIFSTNLSIQQINSSSIHQYVWSWTLDNDFALEFGCLVDPLTSIMSMLISTVGIMVLVYSDNYMAYDQGYLKFEIKGDLDKEKRHECDMILETMVEGIKDLEDGFSKYVKLEEK